MNRAPPCSALVSIDKSSRGDLSGVRKAATNLAGRQIAAIYDHLLMDSDKFREGLVIAFRARRRKQVGISDIDGNLAVAQDRFALFSVLKYFGLKLQLSGQPAIVMVQEGDEFSPAVLQGGGSRGGPSLISLVADESDAGIGNAPNSRHGIVGGGVIHDDEFPIR